MHVSSYFLIAFIAIPNMIFSQGSSSPAQDPSPAIWPQNASKGIPSKEADQNMEGLRFTQKNGHIYLDIKNTFFEKDILLVCRIAEGAETSLHTYAGDEIFNGIIRFSRPTDSLIILQKPDFITYPGDSASGMRMSLQSTSLAPIIASFPIQTILNEASFRIDVTDFILGDNEGFTLSSGLKSINGVSIFDKDRSFLKSITSFSKNTEIVFTKTYTSAATNKGGVNNLTVALNASLVLLPETKMKEREADDRIGYFSLTQLDYNGPLQGVSAKRYIKRWRLEPRPEDQLKYLYGQLVEPVKPIVFYIDPATPPKWIPYMIAGVNEWQKAFEKAGFKNAIYAKRAPSKEEDSTWSLFDAKHSAIIYAPSDDQNAVGPSIADPRTGEILESHINFYHNIQSLLQRWYMMQCGAVDAGARKMVFDDSLMGKLIRQVIAHEVGHTLGLKHNMASSSTVPVDSLRSKKWLTQNGISPSIMDYARFNYVAQPEDSITQDLLLSALGVYDYWALEWGYRWYPDNDQEQLHQLISERTEDHRLWYGRQDNNGDPRIQVENLGDDAVKASTYGIKNLKRIIPQLITWTAMPNSGYWTLQSSYYYALKQYEECLLHVIDNIGGIEETLKYTDEAGPVYNPTSKKQQIEAMHFINKNFFKTPLWLTDTSILTRTGDARLGILARTQENLLSGLLNSNRFNNMVSRAESTFGENVYTLSDLLNDLKRTVWTELGSHQPIDMFRRSLQKLYIAELSEIFKNSKITTYITLSTNISIPLFSEEVKSILYGHFKELKGMIENDLKFVKDAQTRSHLMLLQKQLKALIVE